MPSYENKKTGEVIDTEMSEEEAIELLPAGNNFADSLKTQYEERGSLSAAQWYWVFKLAAENDLEFHRCDVSSVWERLQATDKIYVKFKKLDVYLVILTDGRVYSHGDFVGRYKDDGFECVKTIDPIVLNKFILTFAKEGMDNCLKRIGIASGVCCYCGITLTHSISIREGIGPICAENNGVDFPFAEYRKSIGGK